MKTTEKFYVIEDRGCNIRYTRFVGTKEECVRWIKKHCKVSEIGTYIPFENEWVDNSNWDYSIADSSGYFVPVE